MNRNYLLTLTTRQLSTISEHFQLPYCIWNDDGKSIQISANMPGIGLVIIELHLKFAW